MKKQDGIGAVGIEGSVGFVGESERVELVSAAEGQGLGGMEKLRFNETDSEGIGLWLAFESGHRLIAAGTTATVWWSGSSFSFKGSMSRTKKLLCAVGQGEGLGAPSERVSPREAAKRGFLFLKNPLALWGLSFF
jgi:hypothetical protein